MRLRSMDSPVLVRRPSASLASTLSVSVTGRTGMTAGADSAAAKSSRILSTEMSGRTPSWTATMASSGTNSRAFFTEWKRVKPPFTRRCGHAKLAFWQYCRQAAIWPSGSTVRTCTSGTASRNFSNVRCRMGLPPSSRNCLGTAAPIRVPVPPAVTMRYFFLSIAQFLYANVSFFS